MLVHVTVSTLKSHAIALLAKCETAVRIQDEDVVFLMRQGHEFLLLRGSGPNPRYGSSSKAPRIEAARPDLHRIRC